MGLSEEERKILIVAELTKAKNFYEQAKKNSNLAIWDVVANRLYYSVFHAVTALFIKDQHKVTTHKGAVLLFGMEYVKTGKFSKEDAKFYAQLQTMREKADYNCMWESSKEDTLPMLKKLEGFLNKVEKYLSI
ncbi:MAG: HEPN domain-containing protein [Paludibacteraceae bacterium]|nr:HEPN domain-containing protein [Paludibacteraceae bacterium]